MSVVIPDGVSAATLDEALDRFAHVVGSEHVLDDDRALEFHDPYRFGDEDAYAPSAVLQPASVDEVRAIVRIANELRVPLWTSSQGRNNGYGGSAPRVAGSVVVNLRRMNRVLEVSERFAYALVEPGVSFFDLSRHLRENGHDVWLSVPDLGWGSITGNSLEHGWGYTPLGDHADSVCGMEVVLANGDLLRTGMGALETARTWQLHKRGFGPMADSLFMQSNFGIVTKLGKWLMPRPEAYLAGHITVDREDGLRELVDRLQPLLLDGTIQNVSLVTNLIGMASYVTERARWYDGAGPVPPEVRERMARELGIGHWTVRFALYGPEDMVDLRHARVRRAFADMQGCDVTGRTYDTRDPDAAIEDPDDRVQAGVPQLAALSWVRWGGGGSEEHGGHVCFSPVAPFSGEEAQRQVDTLRGFVEGAGLDFACAFIVTPRSMINIVMLTYDTRDAPQAQHAHDVCKVMVREAAKAGFGEYRAHLGFMDLVAEQYAFNDGAQARFNQTLKDALDPNGILAPGKQGIWPSTLRPTPSMPA